MTETLQTRLDRTLRVIPDFPKPGIQFRDIAPLLGNPELLGEAIRAMLPPESWGHITHVVGIESRGFLFGVTIALALQVAFVPARKPGKLPAATIRETFALEYGSDALEIHVDALTRESRVLIVDDILATGGTVAAACRLVERTGATVAGISVLGEIAGLCDESVLAGRMIQTVVSF